MASNPAYNISDIGGSFYFFGTTFSNSQTYMFGKISDLPNVSDYRSSLFGMSINEGAWNPNVRSRTPNDCSNTAPHFNPTKVDHGSMNEDDSHHGDLKSLERKGRFPDAYYEQTADNFNISLTDWNSVIGRTLVIHESRDDEGLGEDRSIIDGNMGRAIACCAIRPMSLHSMTHRELGNLSPEVSPGTEVVDR